MLLQNFFTPLDTGTIIICQDKVDHYYLPMYVYYTTLLICKAKKGEEKKGIPMNVFLFLS